jgi:hypothetical protein
MNRITWTIGIVIFVVALAIPVSAIGGYWFDQDWTGVNESRIAKDKNQDIRREKTLWDWMQLLLVPAVLAGGGILFNWAQDRRNQELEDTRRKNDQKLEEERRENELKIAAQRAQDEALRAYLDHMGQMLLANRSRTHRLSRDAVTVARARTLTVLGELDSKRGPQSECNKRKRSVLQFLYEADLINRKSPIVDLTHADLSYADLGATLLVGTKSDESGGDRVGGRFNLREANLSETILRGADLSDADLERADLSRADLVGTNLSNAVLRNALLCDAVMLYSSVRDADLTDADLTGVKGIGKEELEKEARSVKGATMPDGSKYGERPRNLPTTLACLVIALLFSWALEKESA